MSLLFLFLFCFLCNNRTQLTRLHIFCSTNFGVFLMDFTLFAVIFVVCLQVYNEQIRDLLANTGPLAVREDSTKGVVVQGLTLHQVSSIMYLTHMVPFTVLYCTDSLWWFQTGPLRGHTPFFFPLTA